MLKQNLESYILAPLYESMPREQLHSLQSERLIKCVQKAYDYVPFYHRQLDSVGVHPNEIRSVDDLSKLPFTQKADLRNQYPFGMLAVPRESIVRLHASSGTTGKPTVVGYTRNDLDLWAQLTARALAASGARPGVVVHNAYGYGIATGGLGFHYGIERLGAIGVPVSGGSPERDLTLLQDFGSGILLCTPSYTHSISELADQKGIDLRSLPVAAGLFGAESWSEAMRSNIEKRWGIRAYDTYGLSEVIGPGVAHECPHRVGLHIYEDHFIPEIIDPDTGEVLPEGELGELVLTAVTKEAMPLIRYRTQDRTRLVSSPCACGRTLVRMERVIGRTNDILEVGGISLFPSQIENVLLQLPGVEPHYQIVFDKSDNSLENLELWVEVSLTTWQEKKQLVQLEHQLALEIQRHFRLQLPLKLVPPFTIKRSQGKAKRLVDKHQL
jgi:phenylacetate-CoA ligase